MNTNIDIEFQKILDNLSRSERDERKYLASFDPIYKLPNKLMYDELHKRFENKKRHILALQNKTYKYLLNYINKNEFPYVVCIQSWNNELIHKRFDNNEEEDYEYSETLGKMKLKSTSTIRRNLFYVELWGGPTIEDAIVSYCW